MNTHLDDPFRSFRLPDAVRFSSDFSSGMGIFPSVLSASMFTVMLYAGIAYKHHYTSTTHYYWVN